MSEHRTPSTTTEQIADALSRSRSNLTIQTIETHVLNAPLTFIYAAPQSGTLDSGQMNGTARFAAGKLLLPNWTITESDARKYTREGETEKQFASFGLTDSGDQNRSYRAVIFPSERLMRVALGYLQAMKDNMLTHFMDYHLNELINGRLTSLLEDLQKKPNGIEEYLAQSRKDYPPQDFLES